MKLTLTKNLEPLKAEARLSIDSDAEQIRLMFITAGAGQAMTYQQKRTEAELVAVDPAVDPATVPHIALEAQISGISLLDQAAIILTMAHQWQAVSALIEEKRLTAKAMVTAATNPAAIEMARQIDWSPLLALAA